MLYSGLYQLGLFGVTDAILNFYFVSLGYDAQAIGLFQAIPRLGGLVTGVPLGLLADRMGVKRITLWAMVGIVATYALMLTAPTLPVITLSRFLLGLFYGAGYIAATPLLSMLTEERFQTHLFSYYNIVTMGASALGSLIGGFLPGWIASAVGRGVGTQSSLAYGGTLLLAAAAIAASLWPLARMTEMMRPRIAERARVRGIPWLRLAWLSTPMLLFGFTGGLTFPFYNLFFRQTFNTPDSLVGTILGLGWLGMATVTLANPWLDRKFGRSGALGVTLTLAALAFFALSIAPGLLLSVLAYLVAVSARNTMTPLYLPLLMERLPRTLHNSASSVGYVLWSLGWFASSGVAGRWLTDYGFDFLMQVVAVGVFLTGLSIVLLFRSGRRRVALDPIGKEP